MKIKKSIYLPIAIILILFFLIQPFNFYCKVSERCQPIILKSLIWQKKGDQELQINFSSQIASDLKNTVEFFPIEKSTKIINGKNIKNFYQVTNLTNQEIVIRAKYNASPSQINKYIDRIECLCFQRQILEPKESIKMPLNFRIDPKLEKDLFFKSQKEIIISYEIDLLN